MKARFHSSYAEGSCTRKVSKLMLSILLLAVANLGHANDNRFTPLDGGAINGNGSFGTGSVTIHHNLLQAERQELEGLIQQLRLDHEHELKMLSDKQEATKAVLEGEIDRLDTLVSNAQQEADRASAEAARSHQRLDDLISDIWPRLEQAEKDIVDNFKDSIEAANQAQASANTAQAAADAAQAAANANRAYAEYTRNNIASPGLSNALEALNDAAWAQSEAARAHSRLNSLRNTVNDLQNSGGNGTLQTYTRSFSSTRPSCNAGDIEYNFVSTHTYGGTVYCLEKAVR